MTTEQNTMILIEISNKLDKIIELLTPKNNSQSLITFSKANTNVDDSELIDRQREIFQMLDKVK